MEDYEQSIVARWNEMMLDAIRSGQAKPTSSTYTLYTTSAAIYDAWAAYDENAFGIYSQQVDLLDDPSDAAKEEAISYAAYTALVTTMPEDKPRFDAFLESLGYALPEVALFVPESPALLGIAAAQAVFEARADDGSNFANHFENLGDYAPVNSADPDSPKAPGGDEFDPNHWQPLRVPTGTVVDENGIPIATDDPASYEDQVALTSHWGSVDAFALLSGDQFRPPEPPRYGDEGEYVDGLGNVTTGNQAYIDQFTEVLDISATLTPEEKLIAEYWADGPRTEAPPGHWNQIAQDIAKREGHGIDDDAKMFLALNAAVFDAGIATWDAKYFHDSIRPQSAIRFLYQDEMVDAWAGPNMGTQSIPGSEWQPYQNVTFVTPPFPEYVSGHSAFSAAAADVISAYVGSDAYYDGETLGNYDLNNDGEIDKLGEYIGLKLDFEDYDGPPIVLQWETLSDAADEAGISRLYGGIHIQDGNLFGLELGANVAVEVFDVATAYFTRAGDDDIVVDPRGGRIVAGPGDDNVLLQELDAEVRVEGGDGTDRVELSRPAASLTLSNDGDGFLFTDDAGIAMRMVGVEEIVATDARYGVDTGEDAAALALSYQSALGRDCDVEGLTFWLGVTRDGAMTLPEICDDFIASPEYAERFGDVSVEGFVAQTYLNSLGVEGDAEGIAFWTDAISSGAIGEGDLVAAFVESGLMGGPYGDRVDEGVLVLV